MKTKNPQQKNGSYCFDSRKALWCLRPESNRYARFHEAADFKCSVHSMRRPLGRMDTRVLIARTVRKMPVLRPVGQIIPSMKTALLLALCLSIPAMAGQRSAAEVLAFKRSTPCPATGKPELRCFGFHADHAVPLCAGGADHRDNLQWLTIEEHRMKTRSDVRFCRQLRKELGK